MGLYPYPYIEFQPDYLNHVINKNINHSQNLIKLENYIENNLCISYNRVSNIYINKLIKSLIYGMVFIYKKRFY